MAVILGVAAAALAFWAGHQFGKDPAGTSARVKGFIDSVKGRFK